MGHVRRLGVERYRSILDRVDLAFPDHAPLILVGENNAGKSNLVKALDLILGDSWPGSVELGDNDFFARDRSNVPVELRVDLGNVIGRTRAGRDLDVVSIKWSYRAQDNRTFDMTFADDTEQAANNEVRHECPCLVVSADRRLGYELSYSSRWTLLSKAMKSFHEALISDPDRVDELKAQFEHTKEIFSHVEPFRLFSDELRRQVEEMSGSLEYGLEIDFSAYDPSNFFHALRIFPHRSGQARTFAELGTGQEQLLAIAFAHAYARAFRRAGGRGDPGLVLAIEEPEAHLHPLAQQWVTQKLREICHEGVQVVLTTHSPAFVDVQDLGGIALVRKVDNATTVVQLSAASSLTTAEEKGNDNGRDRASILCGRGDAGDNGWPVRQTNRVSRRPNRVALPSGVPQASRPRRRT